MLPPLLTRQQLELLNRLPSAWAQHPPLFTAISLAVVALLRKADDFDLVEES